MRKLWDFFFKRSSSNPKRGRSQEQRSSSSTRAAPLSEIRTPTKRTSNPTLLSASHPSETLPTYFHSPTYAMPFSSAPALVQTPSPVTAPPARLPFSDCTPSLPTSSLRLSDPPLSSNTPHTPPVITTTFATTSHSSRPSTPSSMADSTRSAPPRIRIDRNASPARPETQNNVAPFVSDPALLAPKPTDRHFIAPPPVPPVYPAERAERRASYVPGGIGRSYIPGGIGRNFLPGTGDVGIGSGIGMGSGMGLAGITSSSRSRPRSSGSSFPQREKRQSAQYHRSAGVPPVPPILVDASGPGPFARSGEAVQRARAKTFE